LKKLAYFFNFFNLFYCDCINYTTDILCEGFFDAYASQSKEINRDIKAFTDQLAGVQTEINNIVEAIAAGMFHPSMKEKMDGLEAKKISLTVKVEEARVQAQTHAPTPEMIRRYLEKDAGIKNKSPEEQKRIIQAYVKKVVVYEDKIDIDTIVTFAGGGDESRTRVRNRIHRNFSGCSSCFIIPSL
jgi:site-specific DNA recombinase